MYLRARQMDTAKFRRQHSIGPFIVDFCCPEYQLVIELDGGQHASQTESDKRRTLFLMKKGYQVLRFWNHDVLQDINPVLEKIFETKKSAPHPTLSPEAGRGNEGTLRQAQGEREQ
jgi:very-short-patch-repair endonuclease